VPLLMTAPGIAWVLGYTIAAEVGDIGRFPSPKKLCGDTGLCPRVCQSGSRDQRGIGAELAGVLTDIQSRWCPWCLVRSAGRGHALRVRRPSAAVA
jgi:transposase